MTESRFGVGHAGFILASQSPRRKALLKRIVPEFEVVTSDVDELLEIPAGPKELALENARLKTEKVASLHPYHWVIGSDTVVECDGVSLGKPEDRKDAIRMMRTLSGRKHEVHTGVAIYHAASGRNHSFVETSEVVFFRMSDEMIESYVESMHAQQYAGGYPIQYLLGSLVSGFDGSFTNVVGLPVERLEKVLKEMMLIPA